MIEVEIIKIDDEIRGLNVKGHANFAEYGKDIICSAVSAIVIGGFNAFNDTDIKSISVETGNASVIVDSIQGQQILNTIIVQLKTIEERFPKFIKIK